MKLLYTLMLAALILGCGDEGEEVSPVPTSGEPTTTTPSPDPGDPTGAPVAPDTDQAAFEVHSIEPDVGRTAGGDLVIFEGQGFIEGTEIWFGSRRSQDVTVHSGLIIHARSPSHKTGLVDVKLIAPNGTRVLVEDGYLFRDTLSVDSIDPATGPARGGTPVTVRGDGFTYDTNVLIGGRRLIDLTVVDSTTILGIAPPGQRGKSDVLTANPYTTYRLPDAFAYTAPPTLERLVPAAGPAGKDTTVMLIGTAMHADSQVRVGGVEAPVIGGNIFGTRLEVLVSGGDEGLADVEIETTDGALLAEDAFTFTGTPPGDVQVLNVFPKAATNHEFTKVTVVAYGLTANGTDIFFGDEEAEVLALDTVDHHAIVKLPKGQGVVDITVTSPKGSDTLPDAFTYLVTPRIDEVSPPFGSMNGGDKITIRGSLLADPYEVFIGALPATVLSSTDSELVVLTPPGSPGYADVIVINPVGETVAADAFVYNPDGDPEIYAVDPNYGSIAGGTFVRVYGAGFKTGTKVRFAKQYVPVQMSSSSELRMHTPRADVPIAVDVTVETLGWSATMLDAYSYFDPTSPYGGSWGPVIDGTVNITVLDLFTTDPIPFAFVTMGADPNTTYKGFTDERGQITFSDPEIVGPQMITAAKADHTAYSVVEYDAENVTVHLIPMNPSSSGGGGGGPNILPFGHIDGQVTGLGKYLILPKGLSGTKTAYCVSTTPGLWEDPPRPNTPTYQGDQAWAEPDGTFWMKTHLSELAVICIGGVVTDDSQKEASFVPLMMGVVKHIDPIPGEPLPDILEVPLNIPLDRDMPLRLDGAPLSYANPETGVVNPTDVRLRVALDFGSSGFWTVADLEAVAQAEFFLPHQPRSLGGDLNGVTYSFLAEITGKGNQAAVSGTQHYKVKFLEIDRLFHHDDGVWSAVQTGIPRDVHGLWGTSAQNLWAVGAKGLIAHGKAQAWFPQYAPVDVDLNAVWGTSETHATVVGDGGEIVTFNGTVWTQEESPTTADLFGVWGTSEDHMIAVGDGIVLQRDVDGWQVLDSPGVLLHAVWGLTAGEWFTTGEDGVLRRYSDGGWTTFEVAPGTALRSISGTSSNDLWLAGDQGTVLRFDGVQAEQQDVPTTETLQAIVAGPTGQVFAVGNRGVLLRFDGNGWTHEQAPKYGGDLRAVWAWGEAATAVAAGTQVISLGPMLNFLRITSPKAPTFGGTSDFDYQVDWIAGDGYLPTFNFVEMLMGYGNYFPVWWAVVDALTTNVSFPNLPIDHGISPWVDGNAIMMVHRVYKPGATADNFDFWDTWLKGGWTSWSSAGVPFTP